MRSAVICIARDEAPDITEWITYHRALGFDRIVIYDHFSTDGMGDVARASGVEVVPWQETQSAQARAYVHALAEYGPHHEWMSFLDIDEFFVPVTDGSVPAFLDRIDPYPAVAVNWRCYGSSGHVERPPGLITDSFLNRAEDGFSANRHVKIFIRPDHVRRFLNPHYFEMTDSDFVHPDGTPVVWERPGKTQAVPDGTIARINHYQTRSKAHYAKKLSRPRVAKGVLPVDRFNLIDRNEVFDPVLPQNFGHLLDGLR